MPPPTFLEKLLKRHDSTWKPLSDSRKKSISTDTQLTLTAPSSSPSSSLSSSSKTPHEGQGQQQQQQQSQKDPLQSQTQAPQKSHIPQGPAQQSQQQTYQGPAQQSQQTQSAPVQQSQQATAQRSLQTQQVPVQQSQQQTQKLQVEQQKQQQEQEMQRKQHEQELKRKQQQQQQQQDELKRRQQQQQQQQQDEMKRRQQQQQQQDELKRKQQQQQQQDELKRKQQQQQDEMKRKQQQQDEQKRKQQQEDELKRKQQLEDERKRKQQQDLDQQKQKQQQLEDEQKRQHELDQLKQKQQQLDELKRKQQQLDELKQKQQQLDELKRKQQQEDEQKRKQQQQRHSHTKPDSDGKHSSTQLTGIPIDIPPKNPGQASASSNLIIKRHNVESATPSSSGRAVTQYSASHAAAAARQTEVRNLQHGKAHGKEADVERVDNYHRRLFIPNLPTTATKHDLWDLFESFGVVDVVKREGYAYGFVEFVSLDSCMNALKSKHEFQGITLKMRRSRPRKPRNDSSTYGNYDQTDDVEESYGRPDVFSRLEYPYDTEDTNSDYHHRHHQASGAIDYYQPNNDETYSQSTSSKRRHSSPEPSYYGSSALVETKRRNLTDGSVVDSRKRQEDHYYDRSGRDYYSYPSSRDRRPSTSPESSSSRSRTSHRSSSRSDYRQSSGSREHSRSRSKPSSYHHDDSAKERQHRTTTTTTKDSYAPTMERQRSSGRAAPSDPRKRPASSNTTDSTESDAKRPCTDNDSTDDKSRTIVDGKDMTKSVDDHGKAIKDQMTKGTTEAIMSNSKDTTTSAKSTSTAPGTSSSSASTSATHIPPIISFKQQSTTPATIATPTTNANPTTMATPLTSALPATTTLSTGSTSAPVSTTTNSANASSNVQPLLAKDRSSITTDSQQTAKTTAEKRSDLNSTGQQPASTNRNFSSEPTAIPTAPSSFASFTGRQATPSISFGNSKDNNNNKNNTEKPVVIQLICAGVALQANAIGNLEDYLTQNLAKAKCRTMFFPAGGSSREDILKQVHMDGVNALILLEPGFEHHENVFLQVYDQHEGGKDSLHFDEYEGISVMDAIYIIQQAIKSTATPAPPTPAPIASLSPPSAAAPLSFLNRTSPRDIKAEPVAPPTFTPPDQQAQRHQQIADDILQQLFYKNGSPSHPPTSPSAATVAAKAAQTLLTPTTTFTTPSMTPNGNSSGTNMQNLNLLGQVMNYLEVTEQQHYVPGVHDTRLSMIYQTLSIIKTFQPPLRQEQEHAIVRNLIFHLQPGQQQQQQQQHYGSPYQPHWNHGQPPPPSGPYYNIH